MNPPRFKDFVRSPTVRNLARKGLRVASEAAGVAVQLRASPSPIAVMSLVAKVANTMVDQASRTPLNGWPCVAGVRPLNDFALALAKSQHLVARQPESTTQESVLVGSINGVKFGWVEHERWIDGPYVEPGTTEVAALHALRVLVWSTMGPAVKFHQPMMGSASLEADVTEDTHPSATARALWEKHRPFLEAGQRRSILLAGEPGTGKSNLVRHIADMAGGCRLRIRARDLEHLRSLGQLVAFLAPDAVVIDDLDRAKNKDGVLDELDALMSSAKLLMVTVNRLQGLDGAIVRRFKSVVGVEQLDEGVLSRLLEGVPDELAARLRRLPVKYIEQFRSDSEVVGGCDASARVEDLEEQHAIVSTIMATADAKPTTVG